MILPIQRRYSDLLQAMDIYWLPSRSEGVPNTMMEAMAVKKPVVAFDIAGVAELIKNEGMESWFLLKMLKC